LSLKDLRKAPEKADLEIVNPVVGNPSGINCRGPSVFMASAPYPARWCRGATYR